MNQDRASIAEKYAVATQTSDLRQRPGHCDADVLVAAAMITACVRRDASGAEVIDWDKRKRVSLALAIYRYGVTGDKSGIWPIVEACDDWLIGSLKRKNKKTPPQASRRALIVAVLGWYANQGCDYCSGTGVIATDGTAGKLTDTCSACRGTGKKSLEREVPRPHVEHAQWIVTQINQHVALVHREMSKVLSGKIKEAGL